MAESLNVEGHGSTRAAALAHADSQAEQYFGNLDRIIREIGTASARMMTHDGRIIRFSIDVEYHPPRIGGT